MALDVQDMELVAQTVSELVTEVVTREVGKVQAMIVQLRQEVTDTVTVLQDNDTAVVAMVQDRLGLPPTEFVRVANESWERFVTNEAARVTHDRINKLAGRLSTAVAVPVKKKAKIDVRDEDTEEEG